MKKSFTILLMLVTITCFSQGSWNEESSLINGNRYGAFYFSIGNKGYVGTGADDTGPYKSDFWQYDPYYNVWTQKADFGGGIRAYGTGFNVGNKGYAGTGIVASYSWTKDIWEYDPATNTWTQKDDFAGGLRYELASFSIGNKAYVGNGEYREGPSVNAIYYNDFWQFDPTALRGYQWTRKADVPEQGRASSRGMSIGSKGYIGFGVYYYDTRKDDLWEYDPALNTWTRKADLPAVGRYQPAMFGIGNKGYVVGGQYYSPLKDFWEFDPAANTWTKKDDFPGDGRSSAVAMAIGNKGYVGFGNGAAPFNDLWEYRTYDVTLTCLHDTIVSASTGCTAVVNGLDPVIAPEGENPLLLHQIIYNGSVVDQGFGSVSGKTFGLGTSYVYYDLADWPGQQCSFTVTVVDDPPVLTCPKDTSFCENETGTYSVNELVATDNCGISEISYEIQGATIRNGSGRNASGTFLPGLSFIRWTVKDVHGNTSTCITKVIVNVSLLTSVSIQTSAPEDYCYNFVLKAVPVVPGTYLYQWNTGETGPVKILDNTLPDGVYTVIATDQYGCVSKTASYNYQKQNLFSSYTLLGLKTIYLGERNAVGFGAVGVTSPFGLTTIGPNSYVAAPGGFVKSKFILIAPTAVVYTKINAPATVTLPVMQFNTSSVSGLPVYNVPAYTTTTLNGNYKHLTIGKGAHVTLNGTTFGDIYLAPGSAVTMNRTSINIRSLTLDNGSLTTRTSISFSSNDRVSVRISDKVSIGEHCRVAGSNVIFYAGDQRRDLERFTVRARDTHVEANVYIPNGILSVKGNNEAGTECLMTGYFIADAIISSGREVIWNPRFCNIPLPFIVTNKMVEQKNVREVNVQRPDSETPLAVSLYPNPSSQYFSMVIQSKKADKLHIGIYDVYGRMIEQLSGPSNKTYVFGQQYSAGTYMVELRQGVEKRTFKAIKL